MTPTTTRLRTFQLALVASAALGLGACSKTDSDVTPPTAMASSPSSVAAVPEPAPVPAPVATAPAPVVTAAAPAPIVVAQNNGVGAVAGGVGGALVGNQIAGRNNRALGGVVGAVGGGLLGNAIEKHQRATTVYDVKVRMSDGRLRTVRESTSPAIGEKVRVEADGLHDRS